MRQKNKRPPPEKKAHVAEFDAQLEALIRDHKKMEWGKKPTTFLSKLLMTPEELDVYHEARDLQLERLFRKYEVDPNGENAWRDLALELARRHEPGFTSGGGRPKEHDDDVELIFMIELLRCRDRLTIEEACKTIAEKGAIKGKPKTKTLQNRYKDLKRHGWKVIIRFLEKIKAEVGEDQYVNGLEEVIGGEI